MPKQTFLNLPQAKRERFVEIALAEFADRDYDSASVSQIVARAGIAKGSLYQYFDDKRDLFDYLLATSTRTLLDAVLATSEDAPPADVFERLRAHMANTVAAAARYPVHARFLQRAYASAPQPTVVEHGHQVRQSYAGDLVRQGIADGQIDTRLDPEVATLVVESVIAGLGPHLEAQFGPAAPAWQESPEIVAVFDQATTILRRGLGTPAARSERR